MLRRALVIGIDDYPHAPLSGCVADALRMQELLARHEDGAPNFDCRALLAPRGGGSTLGRAKLREALNEHFAGEVDLALLHFSGHGYISDRGGYIVTTDARQFDEGIAMSELLRLANGSKIPEVVIFIDCCHSGALGQADVAPSDHALLREGVSLLTASGRAEVSMEVDGGGVFTTLVCSALQGEAADLFGHVTIAEIYAHVHPYMGAWSQQPRLRANLRRLTTLRRCTPPVEPTLLRKLPQYFPTSEALFMLDPSYEPTVEPHVPEHEAAFGELQLLNRRNLVEPVAHRHMYDAALEGGACRLTARGRHCWQLARNGRL